jgi:hypothetical protein
MIWLAFVLLILANIGALVSIARYYRQDRADLIAERNEARADALEAHTDAWLAESRADFADLKLQAAHIRADCAETALRGELYRQTMQELTSDRAEEPVGRSNVIEMRREGQR